MRLGKCSRTGDIIEPMLKPQWWVDCSGMAKRAVDAVRHGELQIYPDAHKKTWYGWLENIRDWCVSRQLWWGHRVPAYYVKVNGAEKPPVVAASAEALDGRSSNGHLPLASAVAAAAECASSKSKSASLSSASAAAACSGSHPSKPCTRSAGS